MILLFYFIYFFWKELLDGWMNKIILMKILECGELFLFFL
jgi:hypothetical protein